jgi:hypothetical protein
VAGKLAKIPEDKRIYVDVNAPEDEQDLYYEDETIDKSASVHTGLEKQRAKKLEQLSDYQQSVEHLKETIASSQFKGTQEDRDMLLSCIEQLNKTIDYVRSSYDITQIKAKEDDAHIDATKNFLLRDNTPLDDRIYEFINNPSEIDHQFFAPAKLNDGDPMKEIFYDLWIQSSNIFNSFYENGKQSVELKHEDYDIRYRINALIYAINLYQIHNTEQYKGEQKQGFQLAQKPVKEFISPELPKAKTHNRTHKKSYVPSFREAKELSNISVDEVPAPIAMLDKKETRKSGHHIFSIKSKKKL